MVLLGVLSEKFTFYFNCTNSSWPAGMIDKLKWQTFCSFYKKHVQFSFALNN